MVKTAYVTGYKSYELNIFKEDAPEIKYLKKFLANKLKSLIEEGLQWVLIQGQMGIEMWTAETVIELKQQYPDLKLGIITPFLNHTEKWNEQNQLKYNQLVEASDFHDSVHHMPYDGPYQFKQADQFILDHTDMTILIYDEEQEASPKYFKTMLVDFAEQTNYTYDVVTFDEINAFISDIQWSEEESF